MTHDELLVKLSQDWNGTPNLFSAVLAVVELHKPFQVNDILLCECEPIVYPCPTIQAIKEVIK